MIVTSINAMTDIYLNMFRTTEYKTLVDEETNKKYTKVQQHFDLILYDNQGKRVESTSPGSKVNTQV